MHQNQPFKFRAKDWVQIYDDTSETCSPNN